MGITVLPRDYNPWVQAMPQFLQNMALQSMSQKFQTKQATERQRIYQEEKKEGRTFQAGQLKESRTYKEEQKELDRSFKLKITKDMQPIDQQDLPAGMPYVYDKTSGKFYVKSRKPDTTNQIKNYNMALQQYLQRKAPYPGTFSEYTKAQSRAGATKISLGEKLTEKEAVSELNMQQEVKKPDLRNKTMTFLKAQDPDWDVKDTWVKEEMIFKEMNRKIQIAYKNKAVFDEERNPPGWYVGNKLVRSWKDPFKHRSDSIR